MRFVIKYSRKNRIFVVQWHMSKTLAIATVLALLGGTAIAAEPTESSDPEYQSKNARKFVKMLAAMGIDDPRVKNFVGDVDERVEDGYLRLAEERTMGGTLTLHYELSGGFGGKQAELLFTPDDSNFQYSARTNAVMMKYQLRF